MRSTTTQSRSLWPQLWYERDDATSVVVEVVTFVVNNVAVLFVTSGGGFKAPHRILSLSYSALWIATLPGSQGAGAVDSRHWSSASMCGSLCCR